MLGKWIKSGKKGITPMMVVILIIILLILAGIMLSVLSDGGLSDRAAEAKRKHIIAQEKEAIRLAWSACEVELRVNHTPIDVYTFTQEMHERDQKTKIVKATIFEAEQGDIVVDVVDRSGYASVTFTETNHEYFVALLEHDGEIYEVTYDANGGTGAPDMQFKYEGVSLTLSTKQPTREYFYFAYWNTESDGTGEIYYPGGWFNWDQNTTLYAIWTPRPFTITYELNGGVFTVSNPTQYTFFSEEFTINNPRKDNMAFLGWTGTDLTEATRKVTIPTGSMGDRLYIANWTDPVYRVDGIMEFLTLEDALDAAHDGSLIEMLKDSNESPDENILNTKDVRFDLAGHTLTIDKTIINDGTLVIFNSTDNSSRIFNENRTCIINRGILQLGENDGNVQKNFTIEGMIGIKNEDEGMFKFYDGQIIGEKGVRGLIQETADGYKAVSMKANNKEIVDLNIIAEPQARINSIYYPTLAQAIEAVNEDETVVLLVGLSLTSAQEIPDDKRFILDLNGNSITISSNDYIFKNYGDFEIVDSSSGQTGTIFSSNYSVIYNGETGKIKLNGGKIILNKDGTSANYTASIYNYRGIVKVDSGEIKSTASYSNTIYNGNGNVEVTGGLVNNQGNDYTRGIYNEKVYKEFAPKTLSVDSNMVDYSNIVENGKDYVTGYNFTDNNVSSSVMDDIVDSGSNVITGTTMTDNDVGPNTLGDLTDNGASYTTTVIQGDAIDGVVGELINNGSYYFVKNSDNTYIPTNGLTYRKTIGYTTGVSNSTANSYVKIDLSGLSGTYVAVVNAKISSESSFDFGYATISTTNTAPTYSTTSGRFIYSSGTVSATNYESGALNGGNVYYLHLGYKKDSSVDKNEDQIVINSINIYKADATTSNYSFAIQENGSLIPTNGKTYQTANGNLTGINSTTANSYVKIDLRDYNGSYKVVINARTSSQSGGDYGYATITSNTTAPSYSSSTGRFMYTSGTISSTDYTSGTLAGGEVYYLHLGYYKNASTDTGEDQIIINSIKVMEVIERIERFYFTEENNDDGTTCLVPTNSKTYREAHGDTGGVTNSTANSYIRIDLSNLSGKYVVVVNASVSSYSNYGIGYATITNNTAVPQFNNTTGRFMYIYGTIASKDYNSSTLTGGEIYYLHLGYYKNSYATVGSTSDQIIINSINVIEVVDKIESFKFVESGDKLVSNNKNKANTTANSYFKLDLSEVSSDIGIEIVLNATISSQSSYDYGYATITTTSEAPLYSNSSGRFMYISGSYSNQEYRSSILEGGKIYYLHLGYYKNASIDTGNDCLTINSITINEYDIKNHISNIRINGGEIHTTLSTSGNKTMAIYNTTSGRVEVNDGIVYAEGGKVYAYIYAIYNEDNGDIIINDGSVTSSVLATYAYTICNCKDGQVIINGGSVNLLANKSGYIMSRYAINNLSTGRIIINGGNVSATGGNSYLYVVYNESSGSIEINGGNIITTTTTTYYETYGIYNKSTGKIKISGGKIESYHYGLYNNSAGQIEINNGPNNTEINCTNYGVFNKASGKILLINNSESSLKINSDQYGIYNQAGTIEIGEKDGILKNGIEIRGAISAIQNNDILNFYDGIIKGSVAINGGINVIEDDTSIQIDTENGIQIGYLIFDDTKLVRIAETGEEFNNLQEAINACGTDNEKTLVFLKNSYIIGPNVVGNSQNITMDLNNHNIYALNLNNSGILRITDFSDDCNGKLIANSTLVNTGDLTISKIGIINYLSGRSTGSTTSVYNKGIDNSGNLTINENATLESNGSYIRLIENNGEGNITINGGNININNSSGTYIYPIYSASTGTIEMIDGSIRATGGNYTNGIYNSSSGNIRIDGGTISISSQWYGEAIYNNTGYVEINGGNLSMYSSREPDVISNNKDGIVRINGGTLSSSGSYANGMTNYGTLYITGGSIIAGRYGINNSGNVVNGVQYKGEVIIGEKDGQPSTTIPEIRGGTYGIYNVSGKVYFYDGVIKGTSNYISNGFERLEDDYDLKTYTEKIGNSNYKCVILNEIENTVVKVECGDYKQEFKTFTKAIEKCDELQGDITITLLSDCASYGDVYLDTDKNIVLDLNSHILSFATLNPINNCGSLLIKNGTIKNLCDKSTLIKNTGELIIDGNAVLNNTGDGSRTIENNDSGVVSVIDGEIYAYSTSTGYSYGIYNNSDQTVEISGGLIKASCTQTWNLRQNAYGVYNAKSGTIIVNGGEIVGAATSYSSYGIYNTITGTLIINDGNIKCMPNSGDGLSSSYGIYNQGVFEMSGGTIFVNGSAAVSYGIFNNATSPIEINGGNVDVAVAGKTSYGVYNYSTGEIIIKSCNISDKTTSTVSEMSAVGVGNNTSGTITLGEQDGNANPNTPEIKGKTLGILNPTGIINYYDGIIRGGSNYISSGFAEIEDDYELHEFEENIDGIIYKCVDLIGITIVAELENENLSVPESFYRLEDAISRSMELNGQTTITLLHNCTIYNSLSINEGKKIVLNLQSNSIDASINSSEIINNGELTIKSGNISNKLSGTVNYYHTIVDNYGTLTLDDNVTIESNTNYIKMINNNSTGSIIINDATINANPTSSYGIYNMSTDNIIINNVSINSNGFGIYNASNGIITINDGNISGTYGIYNNNIGTIEVKGGNISSPSYAIYNKATGSIVIGEKYGRISTSNPEIQGDSYGVYNQSGTLDFYDGIIKGKTNSFNGTVRYVEINYTIKINIDDNSYICSSLIPVANTNVVASVNGTYFTSLQAAIDYCSSPNSVYYITMINGSLENIIINAGQDIVIDLNSNIISSSTGITITNNGKLQIIDEGINSTETVCGKIINTNGIAIQNNGMQLTIGNNLDDEVNTAYPIIDGGTYGIENTDNSAVISLFDGIIKGSTNAVVSPVTITTPSNYITSVLIIEDKEVMTLVQ